MIREYAAGDKIDLDIIRDNKPKKITVDLESAPVPTHEFRKVVNHVLEITLRELSKANVKEAKHNKGIYVHSVESAGWASLAGLKGGDVILSINNKEVTSLKMIEKELSTIEKEKQDYIVLFVKRGKFTRFVEIHPIWKK